MAMDPQDLPHTKKPPSVLRADGAPSIEIPDKLGFGNIQADTIIAGPNALFLNNIHKAFKIDAHYIRYNTRVERTYRRIIIFGVQMPLHLQDEFKNWVYYLQSRQEPNNIEEFHVL